MNDEPKREPEAVFHDSGLRVKIWRNTSEKTGRNHFNATISKSYKDQNGQWQQSKSFNRDDLLRLRDLVGNASMEMRMLQDQERRLERVQNQEHENLSQTRDAVMEKAAPDQSYRREPNNRDRNSGRPRDR